MRKEEARRVEEEKDNKSSREGEGSGLGICLLRQCTYRPTSSATTHKAPLQQPATTYEAEAGQGSALVQVTSGGV